LDAAALGCRIILGVRNPSGGRRLLEMSRCGFQGRLKPWGQMAFFPGVFLGVLIISSDCDQPHTYNQERRFLEQRFGFGAGVWLWSRGLILE